MSPRTSRRCLDCGAPFTAIGRAVVFCSTACGDAWRRAPARHPHATRTIDGEGYVRVGGQLEHRLVAEAVLGRPLARGETVHHRNDRRMDNRPENLVVLRHGAHTALHNAVRRGRWLQDPNCHGTATDVASGRRLPLRDLAREGTATACHPITYNDGE